MSDLVRREDVLAVLCFSQETGQMVCGDLRKLLEEIKAIPSVEPERRWIPVTEALPEEDEEVLVTVHFDGTKDVKPSVYVETASQIGGTWISYSDEWKVNQKRHHVIAWMPLPEPYRGEE